MEEGPDGWGPITWMRDRVAEAVGRPIVLPHRGDDGAPGYKMLSGVFAEAAEEARPRGGRAAGQPGRPWALGAIRQCSSASLAKGVLCRQERGSNLQTKAVAPGAVPQAALARGQPSMAFRGGTPGPGRVMAVAPLAPPRGCLSLLRWSAAFRATDPVEEDP